MYCFVVIGICHCVRNNGHGTRKQSKESHFTKINGWGVNL